jgi:hypothetical protein
MRLDLNQMSKGLACAALIVWMSGGVDAKLACKIVDKTRALIGDDAECRADDFTQAFGGDPPIVCSDGQVFVSRPSTPPTHTLHARSSTLHHR